MILFSILIFSCFDPVKFFPLPTCNSGIKHILYIFDCRGEFKEQVRFMEKSSKYLETKTKTTFLIVQFTEGASQIFSLQDGDVEMNVDCNRTADVTITDVMKLSSEWLLDPDYIRSDCDLYLQIIFIYNATDNVEMLINETIEKEQKQNISITRFFIMQSSEKNISGGYIYYTPSIQELNISDVILQICDLDPIEYSLTYSDGRHFKSKYYIAKQLESLDAKEAKCYCKSRHGNTVISLETYNEVLYICEQLMNLFVNYNSRVINLHIGLNMNHFNDLKWNTFKPFTFFMPPEYVDWKGCFYLNLTKTKNVRLLADEFYNWGKYLEKVDCDAKLSNALVVCEDYENLPSLNWSSYQFGKNADNPWVVRSHSFIDFIKPILHLSNFSNFFSSVAHCKSNKNRNSYRNLLETYLCGDHLINEIEDKNNNKLKSSIYLLTNEHGYFYILRKVDISKCHNYNECQTNVDDTNFNRAVTIYCSNERKVDQGNGQCSANVINTNLDLEYFQCKTNKDQYFYKCIKDYTGHCSDNSHLLNCENFTCPENFVKCPSSYCFLPFLLRDASYVCPIGDISLEYNVDNLKSTKSSFVLRDICIDSIIFNTLFAFMNGSSFTCKHICPLDYTCLSSRTKQIVENETDSEVQISYFEISLYLSKVSNLFYVTGDYEFIKFIGFIFISFVSFNFDESQFEISNFDQEFQYWDFGELLILNLSYNNLNHSKYFKSIESFNKLKFLNLSHNKDLEIEQTFMFPNMLEIIDLSYTKISALKSGAFYYLTNLRHLNLSYTLINKFKDMGIPNYFKLDTLYIEDLSIKYLEMDFFRGLTIQIELRASEFVVCCPQVLNLNIDVNKCHAPFDIISSCKHLVGDTFKRIVIWIVGILTLVGNGSVLIYRIVWDREIFKQAYGLFITGLAVSDSLMGIYLIIIAIVDIHYTDEYVLKDFSWRNGFLCPFLGILSTLSSEASSFFICLITLDRFFKIKYPFGEHGFSKTGKLLSFTLVWMVSFVLAIVPVLVSDWEIYSSNGLCVALPFSSKQNEGWIFSFTVFVVLNFVLCLLIVIGQLTIFISLIKYNKSTTIARQSSQRSSQERSVALKLAFVAVTDNCCWFPVGILGIISLFGHIFNREVYAWIAVFVLPVHSSLNPFIYTLPAVYNLCKKYIFK